MLTPSQRTPTSRRASFSASALQREMSLPELGTILKRSGFVSLERVPRSHEIFLIACMLSIGWFGLSLLAKELARPPLSSETLKRVAALTSPKASVSAVRSEASIEDSSRKKAFVSGATRKNVHTGSHG